MDAEDSSEDNQETPDNDGDYSTTEMSKSSSVTPKGAPVAAAPKTPLKIKKKKHKKRSQASAAIPPKKEKKEKSSSKLWIIGIILVVVAVALTIIIWKMNGTPGPKPNGNTTGNWSGTPVTITEYSDFQCPVCKRAEETVKKVKELYGPKVVFEYKHFPLSSIHQNAEIAAEASECARDQGKFQEYHDVLFEKGNGDGTGLDKASLIKYAGDLKLDTVKFTTCLENGEKKAIVAAQMAEGQTKGVTGTPAFFINGELLLGLQPIEAFVPLIDKALGEDSGIMNQLYANEPKVEMTVLNDKNCGATCDTTRIKEVIKQLFPTSTVKEVDIASDEGKEIVKKYTVEKVPAYLFTDNLKDAAKFKENAQLQTAFAKVDDKYKIVDEATGATRFVDPAKQKAYELQVEAIKKKAQEKLNIGDKPQIDFFVMSYCPYGNQAEEVVEKVYKVLGDKAVFKVRYVIYSKYQGGGPTYCMDSESKYCSMHGVQEMNQNIRELCVEKQSGTAKLFEFMLAMNIKCSAQNADTCWTAVAKDLKIDTDKVSKCEKDEGTTMAAGELELNQLLGVQGSPTFFINGQEYGGERTPEGILSALCSTFTNKPAECDKVPEPVASTTSSAPAAGCGV
jgi:protein-disulfide isomerase/thiol-disulfide isomerase/thioredoxin